MYFNTKLYIDPGTGSMIFSLIIGLVTTLVFAARGGWIKIKQKISGGKVEVSDNKIPYVIFSDHKRYWNVFEDICEEFEKRNIPCEYWTMSKDDPAFSKKFQFVTCRFIGEGNRAFAKLNTMNARVCLSTTPGLDVLQWKRSRSTDYYVHIYHAIDDGTIYRMFALDHYDAVLLTGEIQRGKIRALEGMRHLPAKELEVVGVTYMDRILQRAKSYTKDKNPDQITVLLAPSWGPSSILNKYGDRFIDSLISTGYHLIIRPHPQSFTAEKELMDRLQEKYPDDAQVSWNRDNDNFDVLASSDILISDFSGVMYDYSLVFDRPIIYANAAFDTAPYDASWFDETPFNIQAADLLGRKLTEDDFDHIKEIIDDILIHDVYASGRKQVREIAWAYPGEAAKRVVDYLVNHSSNS